MVLRLVGVAALAFVFACVQPGSKSCPTVDCPANEVCDGHGGCAAQAAIDICLGKADGDPCSFATVLEGACSQGLCRPLGCGNNILTPNEVCDDGNTNNGDGCSADCKSNETCGNAAVDPAAGEQCDDGNSVDGDGCQ